MGVIITDLDDPQHELRLSWWAWRPLLQVILASDVIKDDDDGVRLAAINVTDVLEADSHEAHLIADYLEQNVLPNVKPGERVLHDGTITATPDDGVLHRDPTESDQNYSVDYNTLVGFIRFCKQSKGFAVE
jgi:hypothetical protein